MIEDGPMRIYAPLSLPTPAPSEGRRKSASELKGQGRPAYLRLGVSEAPSGIQVSRSTEILPNRKQRGLHIDSRKITLLHHSLGETD